MKREGRSVISAINIDDFRIGHFLSPRISFFAVILSPVGYHNVFTCMQIITSVSFSSMSSIEGEITPALNN